MASSEKFCLKWNDFEANVSSAFRDLRDEKDFFDVTLACDDNQIEAHKVIVSACSPFFRNVLKRNPHQHPLLYLKGVKYRELLAVLNFMYQGEVNVAQDDLNCFLSVAEELKVKGLTQGSSDSQSQPRQSAEPKTESFKPDKKSRGGPVQSVQSVQSVEEDDIQEVTPVKSEPVAAVEPHYDPIDPQAGAVALDDTYQEETYDYEAYDDVAGALDPNTGLPYADGNKDAYLEVHEEVSARMLRSEGLWRCTVCKFESKLKSDTFKHVEAKHVETSGYYCPICHKYCSTLNALKVHQSRYHRK